MKLNQRECGVWVLRGETPVRVKRQGQILPTDQQLLITPSTSWKPEPEDFQEESPNHTLITIEKDQTHGRGGRYTLDEVNASRNPVLWQALTGIDAYTTAFDLALASGGVGYLEHVARSSRCPGALASLGGNTDRFIREGLAGNPSTPPDVLHTFIKDHRLGVLSELTYNPTTESHTLSALAFMKNQRHEVLKNIAVHRKADGETLAMLADNGLATYVLTNPNAPAELLERLYSTADSAALLAPIGRHPNTPDHIVKRLSESDEFTDRSYVAMNPKLTVAMQHAFVDDHTYVRTHLAQNTALDPDVARRLAHLDDPILWKTLLVNTRTPDDVVSYIIHSGQVSVVQTALVHANVSSDDLDWIARNVNDQAPLQKVAGSSLTRVETLEYLYKEHGEQLARDLGGNKNTPVTILHELAQHQSAFVQAAVAGNPASERATIDHLVEHGDNFAQAVLCSKEHCPQDVLEHFAGHWNSAVRNSVAGNPNTPEEVSEKLATAHFPHYEMSSFWGAQLRKQEVPLDRVKETILIASSFAGAGHQLDVQAVTKSVRMAARVLGI